MGGHCDVDERVVVHESHSSRARRDVAAPGNFELLQRRCEN